MGSIFWHKTSVPTEEEHRCPPQGPGPQFSDLHHLSRLAFSLCFLVAVFLLSQSELRAIDYNWASPKSGEISVSTSWNPNGVPGASDRARFQLDGTYTASASATLTTVRYLAQLGEGTVTIDLVNQNRLRATGSGGLSVEVGIDPFRNARLAVTNGTLEADQLVRLGGFASSAGILTMSSGATLLTHGSAEVGGAGFGQMVYQSGARGTISGPVTLATNAASGSGSLVVTGAGSNIAIGSTLTLGQNGNASSDILAGGALSAQQLVIGQNANGNGLLTSAGANSRIDVLGNLTVGQAGRGELTTGVGTLSSVTGDTSFAAATSSIGNATIAGAFTSQNVWVGGTATAAGGTSTVNIQTGAAVQIAGVLRTYGTGVVSQSGGAVFAQTLAGPVGTYLLTGGRLTVGTNLEYGVGPLPTNLTLNAGVTLQIGNIFSLSSGTITVNGGTIEMDKLIGTGAGRITLSSGVLRVYGSSVVLAGTGSAFGMNPTFSTGSLLQAPGTTQYPTTIAPDGTLILAANAVVRAGAVQNTGTLTGQGLTAWIDGQLVNQGALNGSGKSNSLVLGAGSVRSVGIQNATSFDKWRSTGATQFGGELLIAVDSGFQPSAAETLQLFEFASISGTFNSIIVTGLAPGYWLDSSAIYTTGAVTIAPVPEPAAVLGIAAAMLGVWRLRSQRRAVHRQVAMTTPRERT